MKNLITQFALITGLSVCIAQAAHAWEPDVEFISQPKYTDISCGASPINATYEVKNNESVGIILFNPEIINEDSFPDSLITVNEGLSTCPLNNVDKLPGGAICTIVLTITPAACPSGGSIEGHIERRLKVGVDTLQGFIISDKIKFNYTALGGASGFAILGSSVTNDAGLSSVRGSIGFTALTDAGGITGPYSVSDGTIYTSSTDPEVIAAQAAFSAAWTMFNDTRIDYPTACTPRGDLDDGDLLNGGMYCMQNESNTTVTVDGEITLSGGPDTLFIFFIGANDSSCFNIASPLPPATPAANCSLDVEPDTHFHFINGAHADNVYWIIGNGEVDLFSASRLQGNVLAAGGPIFADSGNNPGSVIGRLWSNYAITLYGNSVSIPSGR